MPHNLDQAFKYSDQIIASDAGKELYISTPKGILNNGTLKKVFHGDAQRSEYQFELIKPRC